MFFFCVLGWHFNEGDGDMVLTRYVLRIHLIKHGRLSQAGLPISDHKGLRWFALRLYISPRTIRAFYMHIRESQIAK